MFLNIRLAKGIRPELSMRSSEAGQICLKDAEIPAARSHEAVSKPKLSIPDRSGGTRSWSMEDGFNLWAVTMSFGEAK
jgi:hypothetical protein